MTLKINEKALEKLVQQQGGNVDNAQLKEWAQCLSKGEKFIFTS